MPTIIKDVTFVTRTKLDNLVQFPIEGLDINKFLKGPSDNNHVYDLFAVSEHIGGMGGGHYTAICKNYHNGRWYDCNDSLVREARASDVSVSL
jgi:ubiquitin carboxyl-terminal hydrolase 4/11/15